MGIAYRSVLKDIGMGGVSVDSVTITSYPDTTIYFAGDKLDLSGLVVYAEIGSLSGDVTNDCTFTPADGDILTASTNKITVKYGNEKLDIPITIVMPTAITITSQPTKTTYKTDEPLNFTGLIVTANNSEAGLSTDVTSACTFNPAEGTVLDEEKTYTILVSYGSLSASFDVLCQNLPAWDERGLNYNSWETIQTYIKEGLFSTVASVGQTKSIVVNGITYQMQVAGINDGTGAAGTYYPAKTVDFIATNILPDRSTMNSSATNSGGWNGCALRTYLNSTVFNLLPFDVRSIIIEKTHMRTAGGGSTNFVSASDKLWLPTYFEIFGNYTDRSRETEANNKQYPVFSSQSGRQRPTPSGYTYEWWTSTPTTDRADSFCTVTGSGTSDRELSNHNLCNAIICFRIG